MPMVKSPYRHRKVYSPSPFHGGPFGTPPLQQEKKKVEMPIIGENQWIPRPKIHRLKLTGREARYVDDIFLWEEQRR